MAWTEADLLAYQNRRKPRQAGPGRATWPNLGLPSKYRNKGVLSDLGPSGELVGGKLRLLHTFDSQREAEYYGQLKLRRQAGEIRDLELQRPYALVAHVQAGNPKICGYYEADFVFFDIKDDRLRIIDVKGVKTQVYALKKKIVEACWGSVIEEIR